MFILIFKITILNSKLTLIESYNKFIFLLVNHPQLLFSFYYWKRSVTCRGKYADAVGCPPLEQQAAPSHMRRTPAGPTQIPGCRRLMGLGSTSYWDGSETTKRVKSGSFQWSTSFFLSEPT